MFPMKGLCKNRTLKTTNTSFAVMLGMVREDPLCKCHWLLCPMVLDYQIIHLIDSALDLFRAHRARSRS